MAEKKETLNHLKTCFFSQKVYCRKWETFNFSFRIFGDCVLCSVYWTLLWSWCTIYWTMYGAVVLCTGRCMEMFYYLRELVYYVLLDDVWCCCTMYWTKYGDVLLCTGLYTELVYYVLDNI